MSSFFQVLVFFKGVSLVLPSSWPRFLGELGLSLRLDFLRGDEGLLIMRLRSFLLNILLGGMLSMPNMDLLRSSIGWLELLDGGRLLRTSELETLQKVSDDFSSQ